MELFCLPTPFQRIPFRRICNPTPSPRSGGFAIRPPRSGHPSPFRRICNPTGKGRINRRQITNLPKQKQKEQTNPFRSTADYKSAETTGDTPAPFRTPRPVPEDLQSDGQRQNPFRRICNPTGKGRINRRQITNLPKQKQKEQTNPFRSTADYKSAETKRRAKTEQTDGRLQICRNKRNKQIRTKGGSR